MAGHDAKDIAALHRQFIDQALGQGCAARTVVAATRNDLDSIIVTRTFGLTLTPSD